MKRIKESVRGFLEKLRGLKLRGALASLVVTSALGVGMPARADVGAQNVGTTNQVVAGTAVTIPAFKVENQDNCGFQLSFAATNSNAQNISVVLFRSGDNTTFETSPGIQFGVAANGTTAVCLYTNISTTYIGAAGYYKGYWTNAGGADITNAVLEVIKKRVKPSP